MKQKIGHVALIVKDYDEAITFYTQKLRFTVLEDTQLDVDKRWVVISPPGEEGSNLLLAKATNQRELDSVGNQSGGRVFLFLFTDDFWRDFKQMEANAVNFVRAPKEEVYGTVAVFNDLYGNQWDLIQPK